jgi:hypothetical protein
MFLIGQDHSEIALFDLELLAGFGNQNAVALDYIVQVLERMCMIRGMTLGLDSEYAEGKDRRAVGGG